MFGPLLAPVNTLTSIIVAAYTLIWGAWIATPMWDVFDQARRYGFLDRVMPEPGWGILAVTVGILLLIGASRQTLISLKTGLFVGAVFWLFVAIGSLLGDWQNPAFISALALSTYCAFTHLQLCVNRDNLPLE